ncbi:histidine kinase [Paenibacillus sp. S3N08]|uniref:histidine kinase n=2 Tax=Paenibacillus agricola TaxID=2716264 RepID=A0ABX0JID2_9BACL|nr:histidine kinase [Paenibacillus agricola]
MQVASEMIHANTFCIAINDRLTTTVLKSFNREITMLEEGLIVDNEQSYCHLVIEKSVGPLVVPDNMTHPLTKDMDATQFVGGCSFMGVKIITPSGDVFGSLCAFDHNHYQYHEKDVALLQSLAIFFANVLELEETARTLKKAEEASQELLEEKANLLAIMSHEIRTPMNGVMGMASLLHSTELSEEQKEYVDIIESSGKSLLTMLDHILKYSKLEAGKMELDSLPFDIRFHIERMLLLFSTDISKKGIFLSAEFDPKLPKLVWGDSNKIRQVLLNLVSNAFKFTSQGGITLAVKLISNEPEASSVRLAFSVTDTGEGIAAEKVDRLFQSFSQVHVTKESEQEAGTGLGLFISKQLVELMAGQIRLEKSDSNGSCFTFEIPLRLNQDE